MVLLRKGKTNKADFWIQKMSDSEDSEELDKETIGKRVSSWQNVKGGV